MLIHCKYVDNSVNIVDNLCVNVDKVDNPVEK